MNALILVDIQNDFVSGGALEVPEGETIVPVVNRLQPLFDRVVATQDYHPRGHGSFAASHEGKKPGDVIDLDGLEQVLWPVHCVQNSQGAAFVKELDMSRIEKVFTKGEEPRIDSYSGFYDNGHRKATGMGEYLKQQGVHNIYIVGLAADYCVKFTALDGARLGFRTCLVTDATKGVNLNKGDVEKAFKEMKEKGVELTTSEEVMQQPGK